SSSTKLVKKRSSSAVNTFCPRAISTCLSASFERSARASCMILSDKSLENAFMYSPYFSLIVSSSVLFISAFVFYLNYFCTSLFSVNLFPIVKYSFKIYFLVKRKIVMNCFLLVFLQQFHSHAFLMHRVYARYL